MMQIHNTYVIVKYLSDQFELLLCVSGLVRTLHGLNIASNPLDFPPQEIIEKGTSGILSFLREMMEAKNTAKMTELGNNRLPWLLIKT